MAETKRSDENQIIHDKVIEHIAKDRFPDSDIFTNPGSTTQYRVDSYFPDIVVCEKGTTELIAIAEVETADTVTVDEVRNQWRPYSKYLQAGIFFYLYVPKECCDKAKELCQKNKIKVKGFRSYCIKDGKVEIKIN